MITRRDLIRTGGLGYLLLKNRSHAFTQKKPTTDFRISGYLPDYRVDTLDSSQAAGLTDLVLFSVEPRKDGSLDTGNWTAQRLAKSHAIASEVQSRLMLTIGGWNRSDGFTAMAENRLLRQRFLQYLLMFCEQSDIQGIVFDWEFPLGRQEETSFEQLLIDARRRFSPLGMPIEIAVNPARYLPQSWVDVVDTIHSMSYNNGPRHATFTQAKADLRFFSKQGFSLRRFLLGLPFYGRSQKNQDLAITYDEIQSRFHPTPPQEDEAGGFFFNGPATLQRKVQLARKPDLGGVMIWEIGQDSRGKNRLLKKVISTVKDGTFYR